MKTLKTFSVLFLLLIVNNIYPQTVSLDQTFGENGMTELPFDNRFFLFDFDKSGNIIVVGQNRSSVPLLAHLTIVKTNADGIIDQNFGTNGIVQLEFKTLEIAAFKTTNENKIFICGRAYFDELRRYFFLQLNEDGSVDETYGNNGIILLNPDFLNPNFVYHILNCETDEFILFLSVYHDIRKCNYNGEIDQIFGENGVLNLTDGERFKIIPKNAKILKDKTMLIAGDGFDDMFDKAELALCKLTKDGKFVDDFANHGIWRLDLIDENYYPNYFTTEYFSRIIEDTEGNLILLGSIEIDFGIIPPPPDGLIIPFYVCSFNADGILNSDFGTDGFFYHYYNGKIPSIQNILPLKDKYIIGFQSHRIIGMNYNGTLDASFNNTGEFIFDIKNNYFGTMTPQGDNKIVLTVVRYENGSEHSRFLARLSISEIFVKEHYNSLGTQTIYPNPAEDQLYFKNECKFEIMDMQGRVLLKSENTAQSVNVSHLQVGFYFIKFGDNRVEKFIKK
jgi:uncharacterized delta-60 repeat protein